MELLLRYAQSFLGVPYRYGGKNPIEGIDCSGLVSEILKSAGVIPHHAEMNAQQLYNELEPLSSPNVWGLGSIAFYGKSVTAVDHVGFCLDTYRMMEAGGGDHLTLTRQDASAKNAFVRIRPIKFRADFVCVLKPNYAKIGMP